MPVNGHLDICWGYAPPSAALVRQLTQQISEADSLAGFSFGDTTNRGGHGPDHDGMGVCPFAAAATAMAPHRADAAMVLVRSVSLPVEIPSQTFIPRSTIVPTRLPRGPPSLA